MLNKIDCEGSYMTDSTLNITGMTCQSCATNVAKAIADVRWVRNINVSLAEHKAVFQYDETLTDLNSITSAIKNAGYDAGTKTKFDWFYIAGFLVLIAVLMISSRLRSNEQLFADAGYGLLFLTGLLTYLHCVGMCGGITLSQSKGDSIAHRSSALGQYHFGRLVSYTLVGGIMGALGALAAPNDTLRGIVTLIGAIGMALIALIGIFPRWPGKLRLPNFTAGLSNGNSNWQKRGLPMCRPICPSVAQTRVTGTPACVN